MLKRLANRARLASMAGVLVLAVGAAGIAIPVGQASATENASSPFKYLSDTCGFGPSTDVIGQVAFTRTRTRLFISISLHGAPPNSTFDMELWGYHCEPGETLGTVHVNASGDATARFTVFVPAYVTNFFLAAPASAYPGWSETNDVYLPYTGTGTGTTTTATVVGTPCISGTQACHTRTSQISSKVASDGVTVTTSGRGGVAVGTYNRDPVKALAGSVGKFFGLSLSTANGFKSVVVDDCSLAGGTRLSWWNGSAWVPVVSQGGTKRTSNCISVTIGKTSTPNLATVTKLSRLSRIGAVVFGVAK